MTKQETLSVGCLIYTHERVDDAKINQEIIRSLWTDSRVLGVPSIVHAYNGKRSWYPKKHLEDILIRRNNPGHFQGAADLIDVGLLTFHRKFPKIRYVVVLAADTWCLKPKYLASVIQAMQKNHQPLATALWNLPKKYHEDQVGIATDFFIVDVQWAMKFHFFPLRYQEFWKKYHEILSYVRPGANVSVERLALSRFHDACFSEHHNNVRRKEFAEKSIYFLTERMPVHLKKDRQGYWVRRFYWPNIGLVTHHQPTPKRSILRRTKGIYGSTIEQLRRASDLTYFNHGQTIRGSYN